MRGSWILNDKWAELESTSKFREFLLRVIAHPNNFIDEGVFMKERAKASGK
jgi:hypothetical protein